MGRHDGGERAGNSGDEGESVVLGHGEQKVLAEGVQLHLVGNTAETVNLQLKKERNYKLK